ncbi:tyrosine kinase catalytic domain protein [Rhizoctonia solani 123E]|uniref:Tyrosine kinase catalytic domain protein n=1 Tax=Rhizoctonia solani 123E TaxID=1423351 RepID=A0A074SC95_9AGAM|nr:tyrosine kinase catalytic domain protein [Rhizoctonia solani 123E]
MVINISNQPYKARHLGASVSPSSTMLTAHDINSPAPGSIDLDHNIPFDCCQHECSSTPLMITISDVCGCSIKEQFDSSTATSSSVPSLIPSPSSLSSSHSEKVNLAIQDIISSEQRFVSQLGRLVDIYIPQLHIIFTESEIPSLARNVQSILDVHTILASRLKKDRHDISSLCNIIVSYASELTTLHSEFWAGHSGAKKLLDRARIRNPQKWVVWEKERAAECLPEADGSLPRTFEDLMIAPIWRVFTYHFLVGGLRNISENDQVENAVRAMRLVAISVDDNGRLREGEAYTRFILGRIKSAKDLNPEFLATLGPCIRIGALEVVYYECTSPLKASPKSANHSPSSTTLPVVTFHGEVPHPKSIKGKQLAVLLWKGYLVLCKIHEKKMEYEPERWFPLRIDPSIQPTSSAVSLDTLRSVEVISSSATFPHGIRITFGRHVFELGAACAADRDTWLRDISSARVSFEKGNELVLRSSLRKGRGTCIQFTRPKIVPEALPINTVKGLARALSGAGWSPWRRARNSSTRKPEMIAPPVEQELSKSGSEKATESTLLSDGCAVSRKSVANYLSSKDIFDQLVTHGCIDLSSAIDPGKFSSRSVAGGAFADIWKGSLRDGTEVAIKVWRFDGISEDGPKQLKRAMREVYYWSKLNHPHIQELLGVVLFQERVGMVSPWRQYGNLRDYIKKNPDVDRYALCLQVAKGLTHLHDRDMVHGDLKAGNILVSQDEEIKLSDFDHSILSECTLAFSETTHFGGGTLRWMAPELLVVAEDRGIPCQRSKKTDIYSLAMTFLEIITAQVPYAEYPSDPTIYGVKDKKIYPSRPQELLESARGEAMWSLLVSCWTHDPLMRPTAGEVLEKVGDSICHRGFTFDRALHQLENLAG